ncbi:MAG: tetratricopeptide repeat protein [Zoogloeaceae bacterium]|jgi:predicted O-linked N-acetylglucosamine transferase (SPINDLY family)|nr:tetratricopeptide repeat protein [Zoogloeaceae bacterium]
MPPDPTPEAPFWQKQNYAELLLRHTGKEIFKWTHYPFIYDRILARFLETGKPLALLEIGTLNGGSLELWRDYLPPNSEIHGLDINARCLELEFGANIHFHLCDATNAEAVARELGGKTFDVILDDGSHLYPDVIGAFFNLFWRLNPGGVYMVEDLHCSYDTTHGGGLCAKGSSIEFLKRFIDALHADFIPEKEIVHDPLFLPFFRQEIASVSFFSDVCAITKFERPKTNPFSPITVGQTGTVAPQNARFRNKEREIAYAASLFALPGSPDSSAARADTLMRAAIDAFHADTPKLAHGLFAELAARLPDDPLPFTYLAMFHAQDGNDKQAREAMEKAAALAPERADLIAALGEVYLRAGRPEKAEEYLGEAIALNPRLFAAYLAFARALQTQGKHEEAVMALQSAATQPSEAQKAIQGFLLELLAEQGDLSGFAQASTRFAQTVEEELASARAMMRLDGTGEEFLAALFRAQEKLAAENTSVDTLPAPDLPRKDNEIRVAFLTGDSSDERLDAIAALFRRLPVERFALYLLLYGNNARQERLTPLYPCFISGIRIVRFHQTDEDKDVLEKIHAIAPDVLIDADAYFPSGGARHFLRARAEHKILWGDAPLPPIAPGMRTLAGEALEVSDFLPVFSLPGLGEYLDLPDLPLQERGWKPAHFRFGVLASAPNISADSWRLMARVLLAAPDSRLYVNLGELDSGNKRAPARQFIRAQFARMGVEEERLEFFHAVTAEEICLAARRMDAALFPPSHSGGLALSACLWMGRPLVALASDLPWARRPAVFLAIAEHPEWLAENEEEYAEIAAGFAARRAPADPELRPRLQAAGLTDADAFAAGFARAVEQLYAPQTQTDPE